MKLLLFSENRKIALSLEDSFQKSSHVLVRIDLGRLTELDNLDNYDGLIIDRSTWQRCAVLLKYFGALEKINRKPVLILTNGPRTRALKFRDPHQQTCYCGYPLKSEDINFSIDKLFSTPAEA